MLYCKKCGTELSGKQTSYCSIQHSRNHLKSLYRIKNREKINTYNREYNKNSVGNLFDGNRQQCYFCNNQKVLHNHHVKYRPEIILRLCKDCHIKLHKIMKTMCDN